MLPRLASILCLCAVVLAVGGVWWQRRVRVSWRSLHRGEPTRGFYTLVLLLSLIGFGTLAVSLHM